MAFNNLKEKKDFLILNHLDVHELLLLSCDSKIFYTFQRYTEVEDIV